MLLGIFLVIIWTLLVPFIKSCGVLQQKFLKQKVVFVFWSVLNPTRTLSPRYDWIRHNLKDRFWEKIGKTFSVFIRTVNDGPIISTNVNGKCIKSYITFFLVKTGSCSIHTPLPFKGDTPTPPPEKNKVKGD